MIKFLHLCLLFLFIVSPLFGQSTLQQTTQQEKRIALVIGNGNYTASILANPENDARAMAEVLRRLGFTVFPYENLNASQMKKAIDDFGLKLKGNDVGLFYYAGHGIQAKGYNYLIPVDAQLQTEEQVEYDCVRADRVLSLMETSRTKVNVIILDACRNNPFERSWTRSATGRGLALMTAPMGTLIAYATSPGSTAADGSGKNSPYTTAILETIIQPNITITQMFQNVGRILYQKSQKQQTPWIASSLTDDFYFNKTGIILTKIQNNIQTESPKGLDKSVSIDSLTDSRDNQRYKTIRIGNQVWMSENLNYDAGAGSWFYDNNSSIATTYGRIYNWETAKKVCPLSWHLPSDEEWATLINNLGGSNVAGGKIKEIGTTHWISPNTGAKNEIGFSVLPSGYRRSKGGFDGLGSLASFWSSTEYDNSRAWVRTLLFDFEDVIRHNYSKDYGFSVRCIKD